MYSDAVEVVPEPNRRSASTKKEISEMWENIVYKDDFSQQYIGMSNSKTKWRKDNWKKTKVQD